MKALLAALIAGSFAVFSTAAAVKEKRRSNEELLNSLDGAAPAEVLADAPVLM